MEVRALPGMAVVLNPLDEAQLVSEEGRELFELRYGEAGWMVDYWELRGAGWSWRQAGYLGGASQPGEGRGAQSLGGFAAVMLGRTSDRVIRKWRERSPAIEVRIKGLTLSMLAKARGDIVQALVTSASNVNPRNHADRKMALEMLGDYVPRQKVGVGLLSEDDLQELSEEELRAVALGSGGGDGA